MTLLHGNREIEFKVGNVRSWQLLPLPIKGWEESN